MITSVTLIVATLASLITHNAALAQDTMQAPAPLVTHRATFVTSMGTVEIELYGKDAPLAVKNFVCLADSGFFDGLLIHRVHPGFLIQTGDPLTRDTTDRTNWGTGGESIYGAPFKDELNPVSPSFRQGYVRGTLAMANRGLNTNTSQFFILLNDAPNFPKRYTIFGRVAKGMEVIDEIAKVELVDVTPQLGGRPKKPVEIVSVDTSSADEAGGE